MYVFETVATVWLTTQTEIMLDQRTVHALLDTIGPTPTVVLWTAVKSLIATAPIMAIMLVTVIPVMCGVGQAAPKLR